MIILVFNNCDIVWINGQFLTIFRNCKLLDVLTSIIRDIKRLLFVYIIAKNAHLSLFTLSFS